MDITYDPQWHKMSVEEQEKVRDFIDEGNSKADLVETVVQRLTGDELVDIIDAYKAMDEEA